MKCRNTLNPTRFQKKGKFRKMPFEKMQEKHRKQNDEIRAHVQFPPKFFKGIIGIQRNGWEAFLFQRELQEFFLHFSNVGK